MTPKQKALKKWPKAQCFARDDVAISQRFPLFFQVWNGHHQLLGMAKSAAAAWADAWNRRNER